MLLINFCHITSSSQHQLIQSLSLWLRWWDTLWWWVIRVDDDNVVYYLLIIIFNDIINIIISTSHQLINIIVIIVMICLLMTYSERWWWMMMNMLVQLKINSSSSQHLMSRWWLLLLTEIVSSSWMMTVMMIMSLSLQHHLIVTWYHHNYWLIVIVIWCDDVVTLSSIIIIILVDIIIIVSSTWVDLLLSSTNVNWWWLNQLFSHLIIIISLRLLSSWWSSTWFCLFWVLRWQQIDVKQNQKIENKTNQLIFIFFDNDCVFRLFDNVFMMLISMIIDFLIFVFSQFVWMMSLRRMRWWIWGVTHPIIINENHTNQGDIISRWSMMIQRRKQRKTKTIERKNINWIYSEYNKSVLSFPLWWMWKWNHFRDWNMIWMIDDVLFFQFLNIFHDLSLIETSVQSNIIQNLF